MADDIPTKRFIVKNPTAGLKAGDIVETSPVGTTVKRHGRIVEDLEPNVESLGSSLKEIEPMHD